MSVFTKANAVAKDFVSLNDTLINDNISYRSEWESDAKLVHYAYHGNKYPVKEQSLNQTITSTTIKKQK